MITSENIGYVALLIVFFLFFAHGVYAQIKMERDARDSLFSGFEALLKDWNRIDNTRTMKSITSDGTQLLVDRNALEAAAKKHVDRKAQARTMALRRKGMLHVAKPYRFIRKS
jgi:hypothetical protein